jgi:prenylcysteine alpha-carboxyl methylesterase
MHSEASSSPGRISGLVSRIVSLYYGVVWAIKFVRLCIFITLLSPGFLQMAWWLLKSRFLSRKQKLLSFRYADKPRNFLDVYLPDVDGENESEVPNPRAVVIFLSGGGWTIGYKDWGSWIGMMLSKLGVIVVIPDYRNYPQTTIDGMMEDVTNAVQWTIDCIANWGGDIQQIHLVGQSAGAHLAAISLLDAAAKMSMTDTEALRPWSPSQLKSFIGISGVYDLEGLCKYHLGRGLELSGLLGKIMKNDISKYSPCQMIKDISETHDDLKRILPPIRLYHGSSDLAIPQHNAQAFHDLLCQAEASSELIVLEGKTHTDLIIEDPIAGNGILLQQIVPKILPKSAHLKSNIKLQPMVFSICVRIARFVNPF